MPDYRFDLSFEEPAAILGYVIDLDDPDRRIVVGLFDGGRMLAAQLAERFDPDLGSAGGGDGCHGFSFNLSGRLGDRPRPLCVKIANEDIVIGEVTVGPHVAPGPRRAEARIAGEVHWSHGLTLRGFLDDAVADDSFQVLALVEGELAGSVRIDRWAHVDGLDDGVGARAAFELHLDESLADGLPRTVRVETETGRQLAGSPLTMIAFPPTFGASFAAAAGSTGLARRIGSQCFLPNSIPLSGYFDHLPAGAAEPGIELGAAHDHGGFFAAALVGTDFTLIFAPHIAPIETYLDHLRVDDAEIVYGDLVGGSDDDPVPLLFPAFDRERAMEQGYCALCFLCRNEHLSETTLEEARSSFDVFFSVLDSIAGVADRIAHLPLPIGRIGAVEDIKAVGDALEHAIVDHLRRNAVAATVEALPAAHDQPLLPTIRVRRAVRAMKVSVIVATRDRADLLAECCDTLLARNRDIAFDLVIIDNASQEAETLTLLDRLEAEGAMVLDYLESFNFARMNNLAAEQVDADRLCFLNNDVAFIGEGVLSELLSRLAEPDVAAAAPMMVYPSGVVQHGGVVLGPHFGACHAFGDRLEGDPGYASMLKVARECSAVTAALMMTDRQDFETIGGFDEVAFPINFNDVDYCLRLRETGKRVVFTPHALVVHHESVSRGRGEAAVNRPRFMRELGLLRERWLDVLINDPFYHPMMTLDASPFGALSSTLRSAAARRAVIARASRRPSHC